MSTADPNQGMSVSHETSQLPDWNTSTAPAVDSIIEASRVADAAAPDGGYGWVVIGAASVITFWFVGTTYSWGIIQDALIRSTPENAAVLPWVGSLTVTCIAMFALINARVVRAVGPRKMGIVGITLMSSGQALSGFALDNVGALFVTEGLIMGYGVSCCFMVVSITPAQYFSKRRGLANGLVYAGGGIGGAVISLAMEAIVARFGPAWAFWIIALGTFATGMPAAYFVTERAPIRSVTLIEWRLFKDFKFSLLFLVGVVATFPLFVPPFFLPLYANSIGLTAKTGALLVAAFNFSSALGRVLCGFLGDKAGALNSMFVSLLVSALSMLVVWPISTSLAPLVVFTIINGVGNGGFFAIMPTVVGNIFGSARVSVAMGMIVTGWTGGYLLGAPIAGYLLDAYGGEKSGFRAYRPAIFYAGSMALGAAVLVLFLRTKMSRSPFTRL